MSQSFKNYRKDARTACRQLLAHKGADTVAMFINRINATTSEGQLCIIMGEVRRAI